MFDKSITIDFRTPTLSMRDTLLPLLYNYSDLSCEGSFVSLIMWHNTYNHKIALEDNQIYISLGEHHKRLFLLPFGESVKRGVCRMIATANQNGRPAIFLTSQGRRFEEFKASFGSRFEIIPSREDYEYIYKRTNLAELKGRKYHSKRNHISTFNRNYDWSYEPIDDSNTNEVLAMSECWYRLHNENNTENTLNTEHMAIKFVLGNRSKLGIYGGLIRVSGKVVAFSFGSPINDRIIDVHVEKALPEYSGAYTVINQEFSAHIPDSFEYINREDDLGLEGLRKAKLSYYPDILLEKYICTQKDFEI